MRGLDGESVGQRAVIAQPFGHSYCLGYHAVAWRVVSGDAESGAANGQEAAAVGTGPLPEGGKAAAAHLKSFYEAPYPRQLLGDVRADATHCLGGAQFLIGGQRLPPDGQR